MLQNYFPKSFAPRAQQQEFLSKTDAWLDGDKKFLFAELGTGAGKTHLIYTLLNALGGYACVPQKTLVNQFLDTFPDTASVIGSANYYCERLATDCRRAGILQKDDGGKCREADRPICPYLRAKSRVINSRFAVTTYSYLFAEALYVGELPCRRVLCLDEGHNFESELLKFLTMEADLELFRDVGADVPDYLNYSGAIAKELLPSFMEWLRWDLLPKLRERKTRLQENEQLILTNHEGTQKLDKENDGEEDEVDKIEKTIFTLERYLEDPHLFFVNVGEKTVFHRWLQIRPLSVAKFAQERIFSKFDRVIFFSGTILAPDLFAESLGIARNNYEHITLPTPFRKEIRKVWVPEGESMDMSFGMKPISIPLMAEMILKIANHPNRKDVRGIIHTNSRSITIDLINELIRCDRQIERRLIWHDVDINESAFRRRPYNRQTAQNILRDSANGILVSPSMGEGLDLPHDACRFAIVAKIPFHAVKDEFLKARASYFDARTGKPGYWAKWQELSKLIQTCGRGVRDENDFCLTLILDTCFHKFLRRCMTFELVPFSFHEAVSYFAPYNLTKLDAPQPIPAPSTPIKKVA